MDMRAITMYPQEFPLRFSAHERFISSPSGLRKKEIVDRILRKPWTCEEDQSQCGQSQQFENRIVDLGVETRYCFFGQ